jgi:O-antigen ligase
LAFVVPLAFSPSVGAPFLTPKAALLLTTIPIGLTLLASCVRSEAQRPALAALALLAVSGTSTLLAEVPPLAFFGAYDQMTGFLFITAVVCCWAIGRSLTPHGTTLVSHALTISFAATAFVAIAQRLTDLSSLGLALQSSRSTGLVGNPVHAGALFAGVGLMFAVALDRSRWYLAGLVACGIATQTAGSRLGVLILVAGTLVAAALRRDIWAAAAFVCVAAGLTLGQVVVAETSGPSGTSRVAGGLVEHSTTARLQSWSSLPAIVADKPLLGWGPGRYGVASERHKPLSLVRQGGDRMFVDAHNLFVEYTATTGLLGLAALVSFLVLASRGASGPLAAFAVGVFALLLVQPLHPATAPLASLAVGAAVPRRQAAVRERTRWQPALVAASSLLALAAAVSLLVGDARVASVRLDYEPEEYEQARRFLPDWPELHYEESLMWVFLAETEDRPELYEEAIDRRRRAVSADPESARPYNHLGAVLLKAGDHDAARLNFLAAIRRAPRFIAPRIGLVRSEVGSGRFEEARRSLRAAERLVGTPDSELQELRRAIEDGR